MENSYDSFVVESHVTDWVSVPRTEAETVDGNYGLNELGTKTTWRKAMEIVESQGTNFRPFDEDNDGIFDCMVVLHSGAAAETGGTDCESGKGSGERIWSHATTQTWFQSTKQNIRNYRFYVASGVWDVCPPGGGASKWAIGRIAVIAHECSHFLGLPDLYDTVGGQGVGNFELQGMCGSRACCRLQI